MNKPLSDAIASPRLQALNFTDDIKRLTEDFVGREWIFREIDEWVSRPSEPIFILTGEAGIGKSAIVARLTQVRGDIAAYHFCVAGQNSTVVPGTVLRSIAAQLGKNLDGYGEALANTIKPTYVRVDVKIHVGTMTGGQITGVVLENLTLAEPKEELQSLLTAPLSAMPVPARPMLIIVDSLDEAFTYSLAENLVTLLAGLNNLPNWVRFVLTSRSEERVLSYFASVPKYVVAAESQLNRDDLRRYVRNRMSKPALRARLESALKPIAPEEFISRLAGVEGRDDDKGLADGNFLHAKMLLNDVESGAQPLDDLSTLPKSLDEIYQRFLLRLAPDWETRYQPLLAILAVAREPLTREQLLQFGDQSARLIGGRMSATLVNLSVGVLLQFLDVRGAPGGEQYSLFHQSLRDYLGETSRSGRFACPPQDGHLAIANYYIEHVAKDWNSCDGYGRHHLPMHATKASVLPGLLEQPGFWVNAEPAGLRNALEATHNLSERAREVSSILSLIYSELLNKPPSTRAAILHLAALKQAATSVAEFFEPLLAGCNWRAIWTHTVPRLIPYRRRKTVGRVKALAATIVNGRLNIVTLEESASESEDLLSIWAPIEDEVRSTAMPRFLLPGIRVIEAGAQMYIEIRSMGLDSTNRALVAFESLQTIYSGWNFAITVWVDDDLLYTAEADLAGAVYLRPLGSPAMFVTEGNFQEGITGHRSSETKDEIPIAQFDSRVGSLLPVGIGSAEPVIAGIDKAMRLILLRPKQDHGKACVTQLTLGRGSPKLKEVRQRGTPALTVLESAQEVLLVDPHEGHLIERVSHLDMKTLSGALHQMDTSLVETRDGVFLLIANQMNEVLFWDIDSHRFTYKHVFDQLTTVDSIESEGRALVLTGHATSIQVWDAQRLTAATAEDPIEEVIMTTAAVVTGRAMVAVLSWVDARQSMRLTVRDGQTGVPLYTYERPDRQLRPHFLALCQTADGPCVVLQSNWWSDEIEFHCFLTRGKTREQLVRADTQSRPEFGIAGDRLGQNDAWCPTQFSGADFKVLSVAHSQINPSRAMEAFAKQVFAEMPGLTEFWASHPVRVAMDPASRGLAGTGFFKFRQDTPESESGLIFLAEESDPAIVLGELRADSLAAGVYNGRYVAVTVDKQSRTLVLRQPEAGRVLLEDDSKLRLHLETGSPALALGTVAGQVLLAVGQNSGVTVIPITEGPICNNFHIPEQATAISFAPHDMLIIGTSRGVEALRLGQEFQATNV